MGMNHNLEVDGVAFHVQTEDLGPRVPQIVTHVFREGGQVIKVARLDYSKHLANPNLSRALPKVIRAHHQAVTRKLVAGELDSLPALLVLRPSTETQTAIIATDVRASVRPSLHSLVPQSRRASTPPPARRCSSSPAHTRTLPPQLARSPASIWNQLVREAHRSKVESDVVLNEGDASRPSEAVSLDELRPLRPVVIEQEDEPPSSHSWDRAVEQARREVVTKPRLNAIAPTHHVPSALAETSFDEGQQKLRLHDLVGALVCFAQCVQIDPHSRRFRAALQSVLRLVEE
jgi:hypothetical protein